MFANHIDDGLHVGRHLLVACGCAVAVLDMYRLVGQFEHHGSVIFQFGVLSHMFPHFQQILMVVVADADILRTYAWRAHHDVQSFRDGIFGHRHKDLVEIFLEAVEVEGVDIVLASDLDAWLVAPVRIHVLAHEGHLPACIENAVDDAFVISEAAVHVIVGPFCSPFVEPGAECLGKTMQDDHLALVILEIGSFYV